MTHISFFSFEYLKQFTDPGLQFALSPAPQFEIHKITLKNPDHKDVQELQTLDDVSKYCPLQFSVDNNRLCIEVKGVQKVNMWQKRKDWPNMSYNLLHSSPNPFSGIQITEGPCTLELIQHETANTICIYMHLSSPTSLNNAPKTTSASSNSPNSTQTAKRPVIKPQYEEASKTQPSTSNDELQQLEATLDGLLAKLDAANALVDQLMAQQQAQLDKQVELENIIKMMAQST